MPSQRIILSLSLYAYEELRFKDCIIISTSRQIHDLTNIVSKLLQATSSDTKNMQVISKYVKK